MSRNQRKTILTPTLPLETVASFFAAECFPEISVACRGGVGDYREREIAALILAAFRLYQEEWPGKDLADWNYPSDEMKNGAMFAGNEPWNVLLRTAVSLYLDLLITKGVS